MSRSEKLKEILDFLEKSGGSADFGSLYAELTSKYGVTSKTFWGYLENLKMARKIQYDPAYKTAQGSAGIVIRKAEKG